MTDCSINIRSGFLFRIVSTILITILLKNSIKSNHISYHISYLILPVIYLLLDPLDNKIFSTDICTKSLYYQINDKIVDSLTYISILFVIRDNQILKFLILYRALGVILFALTHNKIFLVLMLDIVKEYMIYYFLFKNNNTLLPLLVIIKIIFEYVFHIKQLSPSIR